MNKGQAHIMEYFLLTFFVIIIIVLIVLFLTGWQASRTMSRQSGLTYQRVLFLLKAVSSSPNLNKGGFKEGSMLEDSKLTVFECGDLEGMFGNDVYVEIRALGDMETVKCDEGSYPSCGYWSFCKREGNSIAYELPVNVYRKTWGITDIGILKVGVYV
jgi:hypothetical protein